MPARRWAQVVALAAAACSLACERATADAADRAAVTFDDPEVAEARVRGRALFFDRGGCVACHKVGHLGRAVIGPNLGVDRVYPTPMATRAPTRRPGLRPIEYVIESMVDPDAFVVPTYASGVMKRPDEPPVALTDEEMVDLAAYVAGEAAPTPLTRADLDAARAFVAPCRERREARLSSR